METKLVAGKADVTAFEGDGGGYYVWSNSKYPWLSESKLGAGKLLLHPLGFALPHYADSSKIGFVLQGCCTVGLISPNSSEEKVVSVKKGDAIPLSIGVVSWWFNGGDTDVVIVFLGETTKALVPGQFTYFFMAGALGILRGFQSDFVAKAFHLNQTEAETITNSQPGALIVKLDDGIKFPNPSTHSREKSYAAIDCKVVAKGGGIVGSLTECEIPVLGGIGLSARYVKLEGNAMLGPSFLADGSVQISYVGKGCGRVRVVGSEGKPVLNARVEEGDMFIVPQFHATAEIADEGGMEVLSVITSSKPIFGDLAGNNSIWKAMSPVISQSTLNISKQIEELFRSKITKDVVIVPADN